MLVQKDFLLRQIHLLVAALVEKAGGQKQVDEAEVEQAVGMSLDVVEQMPLSTVLQLLGGDGARALAAGLALAHRAHARVMDGDYDGAARAGIAAEPLIAHGLEERPDLDDDEVRAAQATLRALWQGAPP